MEKHDARYFLSICEEGSFTRAARRCGVSLYTLANAINRLEQEFGGALLYRGRREAVKLTPLGQSVRTYFLGINEIIATVKAEAVRLTYPRTTDC